MICQKLWLRSFMRNLVCWLSPLSKQPEGAKSTGGVNKPPQPSQRMYWEHFRCRILTGQEAYLAEMGKLFQMEVPTGHRGVAEGEPFPRVSLDPRMGHDRLDFGQRITQGNRDLDSIAGGPYLELSQSWSIGYGLTEPLGVYTEWYVLAPGADFDHCQN